MMLIYQPHPSGSDSGWPPFLCNSGMCQSGAALGEGILICECLLLSNSHLKFMSLHDPSVLQVLQYLKDKGVRPPSPSTQNIQD